MTAPMTRTRGANPSMSTTTIARAWRLALCAALALLAGLVLSGTAHARLGIESFTAMTHDDDFVEVTQAGAHAHLTVDFRFTRRAGEPDQPSGQMKDVRIELPPGFLGNPEATPKCSHRDFKVSACSPLSMVGVEALSYFVSPGFEPFTVELPVYNLEPPDGVVAQVGFQFLTVSVIVTMTVRDDGGYNLVSDLSDLSQGFMIERSRMTLWGVPADLQGPGPRTFTTGQQWGAPSGAPRRAFLTTPAQCDGPVPVSRLRVSSWQHPDEWATAEYHASSAPTGCGELRFAPTLDLRPDSGRAGVPAGFEARLTLPQAPVGAPLATPLVRDAVVTLPEGVAISPSASDGLVGCTDAQAGFGTANEPACPAASKIGTATIETPALPEPLRGGIYLGQPRSMDGPSGEMIRIFVLTRARGVRIKLEGRIRTDPATGRITATFSDNPQQPFSLLTLRFNDGPRAPLTTPRQCGTYTTVAEVASWSGQRATSTSAFAIDRGPDGQPCAPLGFAPSFRAGMVNPAAGTASTFTLTFGRGDGDQDLRDVTIAMPPGLTGTIASADLCANALADAGACPEGARIGTVTVGAGQGAAPFHLPGRAYITEGYGGAPFGLAIVVPALAGPYDLGTVVVRAAVHIDRRDASLRIVADPMPTILQGIPLRIKTVNVAIDRPGFMLNPTSCRERRIDGTLRSAEGAVAQVGSRFQVGGCAALPYRPRLQLRVGGRGRTRGGLTVPLSATLRMAPGQANNRAIAVTLPKTINARLPVINDACTLEQFQAGRCTRRVGTAVATTPLLRDPLRGPAYFVRNPDRRLPDLMVALRGTGRGAGVAIDLVGKVTVPRDLTLRTEFEGIPDVPIDMFRLDLVAGRNGPVGAVASLCDPRTRQRSIARVGMRAQSGRLVQVRQRLSIAGCPRPAASARRR